ncbi:uncharacterized protein LOC105664843 [Ceratitis capitata]|uniref:uncharacterized protein LOC105664843 n=1 Tax=Ceratitis capitata TaxID=7213 RepID=UPI0006189663|nr:uncharacterized protein LOC105664843 [Ceratitis capitata]
MDYYIYNPKTNDFTNQFVIMAGNSNSKSIISQHSKQNIPVTKIHYFLWPLVFGVNLYDFLSLCHLVPTHSLHLSRPYLMSTSSFQVFHKPQTKPYDLPMICN